MSQNIWNVDPPRRHWWHHHNPRPGNQRKSLILSTNDNLSLNGRATNPLHVPLLPVSHSSFLHRYSWYLSLLRRHRAAPSSIMLYGSLISLPSAPPLKDSRRRWSPLHCWRAWDDEPSTNGVIAPTSCSRNMVENPCNNSLLFARYIVAKYKY
jgi:hypothetical protein